MSEGGTGSRHAGADAGAPTLPVLVTGADGFVGRHLVAWMLAAGWRVRAAARRSGSAVGEDSAPRLERAAMPDLGDPAAAKAWPALLEGTCGFIHLAGIAHAEAAIAEERYRRINGEAVGELARCAAEAGLAGVFVSSVRAQCGPVAGGVLDENVSPSPVDAYGRAKLLGERLLLAALPEASVLRPVLVYGPGVKGNMASLLALAGSPWPLPFASLAGRRSLLAVDNLASACAFCLRTPAARSRTYLVADPGPALTVGEIVAHLRAARGRAAGLLDVPGGVLSAGLSLVGRRAAYERIAGSLVVDVSRLLGDGWQPVVTTPDALADMARSSS
ncbi:MAG: NAD-dependent epimerase/dehydratase family protein [Rhizobiales bacterium]|nr:NAD-dependent epimerase/dehydratase family protein [Hyphomicrobiales bacterium]